jgi:hypothetical protein
MESLSINWATVTSFSRSYLRQCLHLAPPQPPHPAGPCYFYDSRNSVAIMSVKHQGPIFEMLRHYLILITSHVDVDIVFLFIVGRNKKSRFPYIPTPKRTENPQRYYEVHSVPFAVRIVDMAVRQCANSFWDVFRIFIPSPFQLHE